MPSATSSANPAPAEAARASLLRLGGFVPCSTQDWPDQLAAVVFVTGCPWRCHYCHNPHLQSRQADAGLHWDELQLLLAERRGLLDGVVFSGGEPTVDAALPAALDAVHALGLGCALHTAGCYPARLERVLDRLDWIGLDIKAESQAYAAITGVTRSGQMAWISLGLIQQAGVAHEIRITAHPDWLNTAALDRLIGLLADRGVTQIALQAARSAGEHKSLARYPDAALQAWRKRVPGLALRGFEDALSPAARQT